MGWSHYSTFPLMILVSSFVLTDSREVRHRHRHRHYYPQESGEGGQFDDNVCHFEFNISLDDPMVVIQSSNLPHPSHHNLESCSIGVFGENSNTKYKISYYFNSLILHTDAFIRIKNGRKSQTINRLRGSFIHGKHESSLSVHPYNESFILMEMSDGFPFS